jgi:hypothetical protein
VSPLYITVSCNLYSKANVLAVAHERQAGS